MYGALISGIISGSLYTLIAMGLVIIFRCSHSINFAQGDVGALGAFAAIAMYGVTVHHLPLWLAAVLGILVGALANLLIYVIYVQFLERRGGANIYLTLVGTFGVSMILEAVLPLHFGYGGYSLGLFGSLSNVRIAGVEVPVSGIAIVGSAFVALLAFTIVLYRTRAGLLLRMGASDERLTTLSGVRIYLVRAVAWAISGALAAWGVMLYAAYQNVTVLSMGTFVLYAAVAASWGAFRSVSWTIVGAFATAIVGNVLNIYTSNSVTNSVALLMLIIAVGVRVWRRGSEPVSRAVINVGAVARTVQIRMRALPVTELAVTAVAGLLIWYLGSGFFAVNLLEQACYTIIAMIGIAICLRYGGRLALCAGGVMGLGGYVSAYQGLGIWTAAILAILLCALLGALLGGVTARMQLIYYANITLLITVAVPELANVFVSLTGGAAGEPTAPFTTATLFGGRSAEALLMLVIAILALGGYALLSRTQLGRTFAVVGRDPVLATSAGYRPIITRMGIEALGLGLMGLAGVFWSMQSGFLLPADITLYNSNILVAGVIVGGGWTTAGLVLGSVVLVAIPNVLSSLNGAWPGAVFGLVLACVVLFAPSGVEGFLATAYGRLVSDRGRPKRTAQQEPELSHT